jgi:hypothetical protein
VVVASPHAVALREDAVSLLRIVLHIVRIGLLVLLILQSLQMLSALRMLDGPHAFEVSPFLLAALVFKSMLLLANLGLLCLAHYAVRRSRPTPPSPALRPVFNGESS